jgi:hypothetical protein
VSEAKTKDWFNLFDGTSLSGWIADGNFESFQVVEGAILCRGAPGRLFYSSPLERNSFQSFELQAVVNCSSGARSSIYFHTELEPGGGPLTGYQVLVRSGKPSSSTDDRCQTGGLYGIRNCFKAMVEDGDDFSLRIQVSGKRIQVWVNDIQVVEYTEPEQPVRSEALRKRVLSQGTFALEWASSEGSVQYKDLRVRPLPESQSVPALEQATIDTRYHQLMELQMSGFPLVDLHTHLKCLTLEEAVDNSLQTGINYGITPNCGLIHEGLPGVIASEFISDDEGLDRFRQRMSGQPVFLGMQAEGREWVDLFSLEAIKRYDYVFTDCLTFTDQHGKRVRLWINDEVHIDDAQAFMEMYVDKIVGVLEDEPIDIYVNATYLPECVADQYDQL